MCIRDRRLEGSNEEKLTRLQEILKDSETGLKGVAELSTVFRYLNQLDIQTEIKLDLTLARGLSYYTGAIFEVKAKDVEIGSITGGGDVYKRQPPEFPRWTL